MLRSGAVPYCVFVQSGGATPSLPDRINAAVSPGLAALVARAASGSTGVVLDVAHGEATARFLVSERAVLPEDLARARSAEAEGRAAGMGALAARCATLWIVDAPPHVPEWLVLDVCARLAFAALGPILPPDGKTLLGVRSARELAEHLR